jgi:hypothetical protein
MRKTRADDIFKNHQPTEFEISLMKEIDELKDRIKSLENQLDAVWFES